LSCRTRKMPNSSNTAMFVTAFMCRTFRNDRASFLKPIQTPSSHPTATSDLPSTVTIISTCWTSRDALTLTERYTAGYSTGELCIAVFARRSVVRSHEERVHAQRRHLEHLIRIVDFRTKHLSVDKLFAPIRTIGMRIAPQGILTAELALTYEGDRERPDFLFVFACTIGLMRRADTNQPSLGTCARGISKGTDAEQFQRYRLQVS
jgi:hypothetical protein